MDNTFMQGSFISTGTPQAISLPASASYMKTWNTSVIGTSPNPGVGYEFTWFTNMRDGAGIMLYNANGALWVQEQWIYTNGFTFGTYDSLQYGPQYTNITNISTAAVPRVTFGAPHGLVTGDTIELTNVTGAEQLGGYKCYVTYDDATHVFLTTIPQLAVQATGAYWRKVNYSPYWEPALYNITNITRSGAPIATTAAPHSLTVGQEVRFGMSTYFGMPEIDGLVGTITATTAYTFTFNINTSGFSSFTFPAVAAYPFTPAHVVPIGQNIATANNLNDATTNTDERIMLLGAGPLGPAGEAGNYIVWISSTSVI